MKTLEILKTRKAEIIEATLGIMPIALSGDRANRTFFFKVDEETGELTVDYLYYLGQQSLSDNCFYTIRDYETLDPEEFGYETFEEMDFAACGFSDQIEYAIDCKIVMLQNLEALEHLTHIEETLYAQREVLSQMQDVNKRLHIGYNLIAQQLGAIAWQGNIMSTWGTFIMPDLSVKFGHVSSPNAESECVIDVSSIGEFSGIATRLAFNPSKFREGVPSKVENLEGYNETWK